MQVHRPDFAALIAALEANLPPEPKRAPLVTPPRQPSRSFAQQAKDLAEDDRITHALLAPVVVVRMQDHPYRPEGFDFAYVDRKGRQGAVIPKQEPKADWPFPDPVEKQDVPTEWQSGPPPSCGWFNCQDDQDRRCHFTELARHWDGTRWSTYTGVTDVFTDGAARVATMPSFEDCFSGMGVNICWRGPCLAGADLPQLAAALHDVPSAQDCRTAYLVAPQDDKRSDLALLREFVPHAGPIGDLTAAENVPPHRRAEFIRRCNELR